MPEPVSLASDLAGHVLVVDDDRVLLAVMALQLAEASYHTSEAASGDEAWNVLCRNHNGIDAILLDRNMPGFDNVRFLQALKESEFFNPIPVIMVTGEDVREDIAQNKASGLFHYLVKPVPHDLLISVVASAVKERRQGRQHADC